jgi:hypothetical protein
MTKFKQFLIPLLIEQQLSLLIDQYHRLIYSIAMCPLRGLKILQFEKLGALNCDCPPTNFIALGISTLNNFKVVEICKILIFNT